MLLIGLVLAFHTQIVSITGIVFSYPILTKVGFAAIGIGAIWMIIRRLKKK